MGGGSTLGSGKFPLLIRRQVQSRETVMESSECGAVLVTRCCLIIFALIAAVPLTSHMELLRLRDVVTPPKSHSQYVIELFMDDRH